MAPMVALGHSLGMYLIARGSWGNTFKVPEKPQAQIGFYTLLPCTTYLRLGFLLEIGTIFADTMVVLQELIRRVLTSQNPPNTRKGLGLTRMTFSSDLKFRRDKSTQLSRLFFLPFPQP